MMRNACTRFKASDKTVLKNYGASDIASSFPTRDTNEVGFSDLR